MVRYKIKAILWNLLNHRLQVKFVSSTTKHIFTNFGAVPKGARHFFFDGENIELNASAEHLSMLIRQPRI
jgi:hypothetical protein